MTPDTVLVVLFDPERISQRNIEDLDAALQATAGGRCAFVAVKGGGANGNAIDIKPVVGPGLTGFETENGPAYLSFGDIVGISQPVQKGSRPVCRALMLRGGHKVYVTENEVNRAKLLPLLPADAPSLAQAAPTKPARGPGRPKQIANHAEEHAAPAAPTAGARAGKLRGRPATPRAT